MADTTTTTTDNKSFDLMTWIKENMILAGAVAVGLIMFMFMGKKKTRQNTVRLSKSALRRVRSAAASGAKYARRTR